MIEDKQNVLLLLVLLNLVDTLIILLELKTKYSGSAASPTPAFHR